MYTKYDYNHSKHEHFRGLMTNFIQSCVHEPNSMVSNEEKIIKIFWSICYRITRKSSVIWSFTLDMIISGLSHQLLPLLDTHNFADLTGSYDITFKIKRPRVWTETDVIWVLLCFRRDYAISFAMITKCLKCIWKVLFTLNKMLKAW